MTWQPIETAPKDWTWFLAYDAVSGEYSTFRYDGRGFAPDDWTPTHWMPLPAPPAEDREP